MFSLVVQILPSSFLSAKIGFLDLVSYNPVLSLVSLLTRGTSGLYIRVGGPGIQTSAKPASDWLPSQLLIG